MSRINTLYIKLNNLCLGAIANCIKLEASYVERRKEVVLRELYLKCKVLEEERMLFWSTRMENEKKFWEKLKCICSDMEMLLNNIIKCAEEKIVAIPEDVNAREIYVECLRAMIDDYLRTNLMQVIDLKGIVSSTALEKNYSLEQVISLLESQDLKSTEFHYKFVDIQRQLVDFHEKTHNFVNSISLHIYIVDD